MCTKPHWGAVLILGALLLPALHPAGAAAIVNGTPPNRAWPAQALVSIAGGRSCGGTLVSGRWVLTAGHCVTDNVAGAPKLAATAFTVSLGATDTTQFSGPNQFAVDDVLRAPDFLPRNGTASDDLGLLHLAGPTPDTPEFEPMRLVTAGETALWEPGTVATVIGWGSAVFRGPRSTRLQQAGVPITTDDFCVAAYPVSDPNPFVIASMLCAGDGVQDTCTGDSGGPLMVPRVDTFVLAGVTSFGFQCGDAARSGVYARAGAPALNTWIRDTIPSAAIAISPATPNPDDAVTLTATLTTGAGHTGLPVFRWDLNDDGRYDDALGASAALPRIRAGSTVVRVQETYPDGDRALAREVITTAGSPLPRPPPPPPPPPKPVAPVASRAPNAHQDDAQPVAPLGASASGGVVPALARLLAGPRRMRVRSLLDGRMSIGVRCSVACTLRARLTLDGRTAHRIGLSKFIGSTLIGSANKRLRKAGKVTLVIRLKPHAVRALRRAKDGATRVRIDASAGPRKLRLERTITLHF